MNDRSKALAKHEMTMCETGITSLEWEIKVCNESKKLVETDPELLQSFEDDLRILNRVLRYYKDRKVFLTSTAIQASRPNQPTDKPN